MKLTVITIFVGLFVCLELCSARVVDRLDRTEIGTPAKLKIPTVQGRQAYAEDDYYEEEEDDEEEEELQQSLLQDNIAAGGHGGDGGGYDEGEEDDNEEDDGDNEEEEEDDDQGEQRFMEDRRFLKAVYDIL
ncbi:nucleolar transcription factor 1-like [Musca vetustissima]|uniref:nucleolar transcription factor 1-like n=1 Tax=Musca vetustissima TaxID=27455 RepID=UPI002AB7967E|nr:nucleolar transcription factor 1-like [Musca vetustissima]